MKNKARTANIVYKALGFRWLNQAFFPALAFVSADRNEARNPQRFIHVTVVCNGKRQQNKMCKNRKNYLKMILKNN